MAVKHGAIGEFNSDQEDWVSYIEHLDSTSLLTVFLKKEIKEELFCLAPVGQPPISC